MSNWPVSASGGITPAGVVPSASRGINVALPTAGFAKTAWVELIATTPVACESLTLHVGINRDYEQLSIDLALGASGSERIILENFALGKSGGTHNTRRHTIPLSIPRGERIAFKIGREGTSSDPNGGVVAVSLHAASGLLPIGAQLFPTYGFSTSTMFANVFAVASATANTKGAWVELIASAPDDANWLGVVTTNRGSNGGNWLLCDIAFGASGSEVVAVENLFVNQVGATNVSSDPIFLPLRVPRGTRVSVRAAANYATGVADSRSVGFIAYLG